MKGILKKTEQGWIVQRWEVVSEKEGVGIVDTLPLHPEDIRYHNMMNWNGREIEFEIVTEIYDDGSERKYAKTIKLYTSSKLDLSKLEHKLDDALLKESDEDLSIWLRNKRHQSITKALAISFAKWLAYDWMPIWVEDKFMWEHAAIDLSDVPENCRGYKTEEELFELYKAHKS